MARLSITTLCLAVSAIACARQTPGIEVSSTDFDINPLVGQWRGTYNSNVTGRSGTIAFTLLAGESSASGNVVMIPRADSLLTPEERETLNNVSTPTRQVISIHFVRKQGGSVHGTLDPYRDPDCGCTVTTTFDGAFTAGPAIEGVYATVPSAAGGTVSGGTWKVTRVKKL
ncbi:MAG TPA: hypothetical protein VLJ83_09040 [Gemmatimonadaceae bacterium]|nr:hypothetical protein [Gemmatimonadaceae bacterium]